MTLTVTQTLSDYFINTVTCIEAVHGQHNLTQEQKISMSCNIMNPVYMALLLSELVAFLLRFCTKNALVFSKSEAFAIQVLQWRVLETPHRGVKSRFSPLEQVNEQ